MINIFCRLWNRIHFLYKIYLSISLCLLLCLLIITGTTQISTRNTLRENAIANGQAAIATRSTLLELNLAQIAKISGVMYSNSDVYSMLRSPSMNAIESYRITTFMRSMMNMPAEIPLVQIYLDIYTSNDSFIIAKSGNSSFGPSHYHVSIPDYIEPGEVYCEGPHLSNNYGYSIGSSSLLVYTFHWKLYDNAQTHVIGTLSFDVALEDMMEYVFPEEDKVGYLMQSGGMVFANHIQITDQNAREILEDCRRAGGANEIQRDSFKGIAFCNDAELNNVTLSLVELVPDEVLYADADQLLWRNLLVILVTFGIMCLILFFISRELTTPIRKMDQCMQAIETSGDLTYRLTDHVNYPAKDELGNLIRQTDQVLETVEKLFQRQQMLSQAQRDAEARMLQAQINPHFLYNSLQSLAALALSHGDREVFNYITMLGSRMHYSMNMETDTATLQQEVEYVENYLILQNVRFGNGMQADIRIDPAVKNLTVPRMILQPLAENAFKHGKLCRTPGTFLRLYADKVDSHLILIMENNGRGIPSEHIEELNHQFSIPGVPEARIGEHIGMLSVLYRLRLFFNNAVTMHITAPEDTDATVRIEVTIPL